MGGFFSAIGNLGAGAGDAAATYGHQIRGLLESRRKDFSDLIGNAAQSETDPQTRTALLKHQSDLISGKPIGKITADFQKTVQGRIADQQALHGVIGQPPQAPAPQPGPAQPGSVPGVLPPVQQPPAHTSPLAKLISAIRGPSVQVGEDVTAQPGAPPVRQVPTEKDQRPGKYGDGVPGWPSYLPTAVDSSISYAAEPGDISVGGAGTAPQSGSAIQPIGGSAPTRGPAAPVAAQPSSSPIAGPQGGIITPPAQTQAAPLNNGSTPSLEAFPVLGDGYGRDNKTGLIYKDGKVVGHDLMARPGDAYNLDVSRMYGLDGGHSAQSVGPQGAAQTAAQTTAQPPPPAPIRPIEDPRARRAAILADYGNQYRNATPAMRPMITAQMNDAIQQLQPFEQTAARKAAFEEFSNTPEFKALPAFAQQAYRAQAFGLAPVNMPQGALVPTKYQSRAEDLDPSVRAQFGLGSYKGPITISKSRTDGSIIDVVPGNAGVSIINNPDGTQSFALKTPGESAGVTASQVAPRATGVDAAGHPTFESVADMKKGIAPVTGAGVNPSFVPTQSTSTSQQPGQLPTTIHTVRSKGGGSAAPAPIVAPNGTLKPISGGATSVDPITKRKYDDWAAGGTAPTGKDLSAVQAYAEKSGLPTPTALSAAGQANLQGVDAVFSEIDDAMKILDKFKGSPSIAVDYMKYKHLGQHTPYDELFTKLSFEGLRSAAAAMKGNGSRAYPIIQKAFEHVPNLDRWHGLNPDSIDLMKDKLKAMRDVLGQAKTTILQDQRKSGVVGGAAPITAVPGAASAVDDLINKYK